MNDTRCNPVQQHAVPDGHQTTRCAIRVLRTVLRTVALSDVTSELDDTQEKDRSSQPVLLHFHGHSVRC